MGRSAVKASGFLSSYFREKEGFDVEQQVGSLIRMNRKQISINHHEQEPPRRKV